jgi:hypothetical protein
LTTQQSFTVYIKRPLKHPDEHHEWRNYKHEQGIHDEPKNREGLGAMAILDLVPGVFCQLEWSSLDLVSPDA